MADDKKKRKSVQEQVTDVVAQQQSALGAAGTAYEQGAQAALDAYKQGQQQVIDETAQGYEAQRQSVNEAYESIYGENGILGQAYKEREQRLKDEEARAAQENKTNYDSAKWTGLTEVAASIANLIGVGAMGASNQQYHQYSQDWMRKADADAKANRNRIDRIRENLYAQKERLGQGRLQGALALSQLDRERLNQLAGMKGNLNSAEYKAILDTLGMGYQNRVAQANAGAQGGIQAASMGMQEENMREGREIQRASLAQSRNQFAAQMLAKGYNPDGSVNDAAMAKVIAANNAAKSGSGSGSSSGGDNYDVTIGGRNFTLTMSKETRKQAVLDGKPELKDDLVRMLGASSWDEVDKGTGKKGKYREYAALVDALNGTGDNDADDAVIERFVQDHRGEVEKFNTHLARVASRAADYGASGSAARQSAASGRNSVDDEFGV